MALASEIAIQPVGMGGELPTRVSDPARQALLTIRASQCRCNPGNIAMVTSLDDDEVDKAFGELREAGLAHDPESNSWRTGADGWR